ncbi:hypothetical protein LTR37_002550 [Vermiconidia calcicola]|uniref:Uncharacterized protein n=1 Tax=Vermiconidia calcicola TaxID=1690605 RepID=A0ACC3NRZ3_9PEZI|nr:hypothetical protein LTR37_002550 [Vermiconidia calcicola]
MAEKRKLDTFATDLHSRPQARQVRGRNVKTVQNVYRPFIDLSSPEVSESDREDEPRPPEQTQSEGSRRNPECATHHPLSQLSNREKTDMFYAGASLRVYPESDTEVDEDEDSDIAAVPEQKPSAGSSKVRLARSARNELPHERDPEATRQSKYDLEQRHCTALIRLNWGGAPTDTVREIVGQQYFEGYISKGRYQRLVALSPRTSGDVGKGRRCLDLALARNMRTGSVLLAADIEAAHRVLNAEEWTTAKHDRCESGPSAAPAETMGNYPKLLKAKKKTRRASGH